MTPEPSQPSLSAVKESAPQAPRVQLRQASPVVLGKGSEWKGRNLTLGICAVLLSTPLAGVAFTWAPKETFVAATTGLLLALLIFLALQLHLMIQRHGIFMLLSVGLLLTLAVPVGVRMGSTGLDWMSDLSELRAARSGLSGESGSLPLYVQGGAKAQQSSGAVARQTPNPNPVPPASVLQAGAVSAGAPSGSSVAVGPGILQEALSPDAAKQAEQDLIDQMLAKTSREDPQAATRMAQKEMQRRYPALEDASSREANLYREAYNELGRLRKFEFFKDPLWPLKIAEMVAAREGWKRADLGAAVSPDVERGGESIAAGPGAPENVGGGQVSRVLPGEELALDGPGATGVVPAEDSHLQEVKRAMIEARKRYPAIGIEGSDENRAYVDVYSELDKFRRNFFDKPDWPIRLVELVAKREGWKSAAESKQASEAGGAELRLPK